MLCSQCYSCVLLVDTVILVGKRSILLFEMFSDEAFTQMSSYDTVKFIDISGTSVGPMSNE